MDASYVSNITEFAIVLAGFSGLVIAIGSKEGRSNPLVKQRTIVMLLLSFSAGFGSLLPTLALALEVDDIWKFSSYALFCLLIGTIVGVYLTTRLLLNKEQRQQLRAYMYVLIFGVNTALVILLISIPVASTFLIALVWQLILSAILFTRLILQS